LNKGNIIRITMPKRSKEKFRGTVDAA